MGEDEHFTEQFVEILFVGIAEEYPEEVRFRLRGNHTESQRSKRSERPLSGTGRTGRSQERNRQGDQEGTYQNETGYLRRYRISIYSFTLSILKFVLVFCSYQIRTE